MNVRFVIMDLIKSVTAATNNGKWYQKYLDRGGRWVTIKEGPLEGRHILIDGQGYIMGGKGIPKKVIDKLNGGHIDMTFGKYESADRKDAVDQTHKELGEQKIEDKKGTWSFHHVTREKHEQDGKHDYRLYVKHDKLAGQTGEGWGLHGGVHMRHDSTIDDLKSRLKNASGYTPDKATLEAMMEHFNKLKAAYDEQDRHYAGGDKDEHKKTVEDLLQSAIERAKNGDKVGIKGQEWRESNMKDFEKYLTKDEINKLREAQKYLRGNSQYDHSESNHGVTPGLDNLHGINSHIWQERVAQEKKLEQEKKDARKSALDHQMETDPALRKLVAHAVAARKAVPDKYGHGASERELAYRLFGYATNEDQARKAREKVRELEKKLGLASFELEGLARQYKDDVLPAVQPEHSREAGKIYFGDKVYSPKGTVHEVTKVGQKYLHLRGGIQTEHGKNKLFENSGNENRNPQNMDEARDAVMHILHNHEYHGGAHLKNMEHVAKHMADQAQHNRHKLDQLRKLQMHIENPHLKAAIGEVIDETRRHELTRMLSGSPSDAVRRGLQEQLDKLGPSNIGNVDEYKEQPKAAEPEPTPTPAPSPAPAPPEPPKTGGGKGKGEKAPKLGYGDDATMHVPGSKDTFKHMKQLKHVHGGKWNGEANRWEFNHAHGSEGHKALEEYATGAGIGFHLHDNKGGGEAAPSPAPAPEPPKEEVSNEGGKKGAFMFKGNTYPHKYALKTEHGAEWKGYLGADGKKTGHWEVPDVAHGSDLHKKLQQVATDRGLTGEHEHDEKQEPSKPKRDLAKETIAGLTSNMPSREEIENHFQSKGDGAPDDWAKGQADKAEAALNEFKKNPHLIPHGDEDLAYRRSEINPDRDALATAHHALRHAKEAHEEAQESERRQKEYEEKQKKEAEERHKREEALKSSYPQELNKDANLSYLQKNPPTLEELQNFYKHRDQMGPAHPAGGVMIPWGSASRENAVNKKAQDVHDAIKEYLGNPKLHQHMADRMMDLLSGPNAGKTKGSGLLDSFPHHLEEAKKRASSGGYTSKIGAKISLSANDTVRVRGIKGAGIGEAHRIKVTDPTNGRSDVKYVPVKWAGDKNRIAQQIPGVGQDGVDFIHHVLNGGDPQEFNPESGPKVKPTSKFEKFPSVPDKSKEIDGFMDKAKGDLLAHGASDVAFTTKGTKAQRAKTAHIIATGFRALHHMLGGDLPPVSVTIGPTYSRALAHYSPAGRSIVIDPDKGQNSFFHEFGHFLDDAMHDFKRGNIGSRMSGEIHNPFGSRHEKDYHEKSPMAELGKAIKETDSWNNRKKEMDGKGKTHGFTAEYRRYFDSDIESFARFFSQWAGHEGRKRGYELPADLADPKETEWEYGEHYTPEELDKVGEVLKKVFKNKGLLKGLLAFLDSLGERHTRYVISI